MSKSVFESSPSWYKEGGLLQLIDFGIVLCFKAKIGLIKPAIPAQDFKCPICVLIEPTATC
jgi:hypothetical protein